MKKQMKLVVAGASVLTLGMVGQAMAFHDGGVAKCESCHTMHNSLGGAKMTKTTSVTGNAGAFLLQGSDQSSTCLNCHGAGSTLSSYHVKTEGVTTGGLPLQRTPGGDFSWIQAACNGQATGDKRGHNIIAADFGFAADGRATMATAPGGTYPNSQLHCSSCHDPHGKYRVDEAGVVTTTGKPIRTYGSYGATADLTSDVGAYRILGGVGYQPKSLINAGVPNVFANTIPAAVAPSTYNSTAAGGLRVAYGSGMSEWCANCHSNYHADGQTTGGFGAHPAGNGYKLNELAANYNTYVSSGKMTGTQATANLNLVPFETGNGQATADRTAMVGLLTSTAGPDATANVMCLSCHRAHASGNESMLRWNQTNTFLTDTAGVYTLSSGNADATVQTAAYYGKASTDFGATQRSLCNKCHAKD